MHASATTVARHCFNMSVGPCTHLRHLQSRFYNSSCALATSGGAGGDGQIQPPNVRDLARMANIGVTDEEVKEWGPKIEKIVEWFGQLQDVDLEGVPPAVRADIDSGNFLRPDEARNYENKGELLSQVPDMDGSFLRVPKTKTSTE